MVRLVARLGVIFLVLYLAVGFFYDRLEKRLAVVPAEKVLARQAASPQAEAPRIAAEEQVDYDIIVTRNIFQAPAEPEESNSGAEAQKKEEPVPTTLKLTLLGTAAGSQRSARAIILDQVTKKQDIYQVGDAVQKAIIRKIERGRVILRLNGRDEILLIEEPASAGGPPAGLSATPSTRPAVKSRAVVRKRPPLGRPPLVRNGKPRVKEDNGKSPGEESGFLEDAPPESPEPPEFPPEEIEEGEEEGPPQATRAASAKNDAAKERGKPRAHEGPGRMDEEDEIESRVAEPGE